MVTNLSAPVGGGFSELELCKSDSFSVSSLSWSESVKWSLSSDSLVLFNGMSASASASGSFVLHGGSLSK